MAWTTERVLRRILPDEAGVEWVDPSAKVMMVERSIPAAWAGHPLADLEHEGRVRVAVLSRMGVGQVPRPQLVLQEGDIAYLAVGDAALSDLDARLAARPSGH